MKIIFTVVLLGLVVLLGIPSRALSQSQPNEDNLETHIHVYLKMIRNGHEVIVPALIGIRPSLWNFHGFDNYGGKPLDMSALHTHDFSGEIHVESTAFLRFTLADFFQVWGLDEKNIVNVTSNGKIINYREEPLIDLQELTIELKPIIQSQIFSQKEYPEFKLSFQYPVDWTFAKIEPNATQFESALGEQSLGMIELFPNESNYLNYPFFTIEVDELPSNNITLDQYTIAYMPILLHAGETWFPEINSSRLFNFNGNPSRNLTILANNLGESGYIDYGNVTERIMQIWTIKNNLLYIISYYAYFNSYIDYMPTIRKILDSIILG